jgi:hypothetical protein
MVKKLYETDVWYNAQLDIFGLSLSCYGHRRIEILGDPKGNHMTMITWGMIRSESEWNKVHWYRIGKL